MHATIKFSPKGSIDVLQGDHLVESSTNLFTKYGLENAYKPGKNVIMRVSDGGIFKHFHVGDGTTAFTPNSTGLTEHSASATRTSSTLTYRTDPNTSIRYAIFTTVWNLPSGLDGFSEFCMSDNADPELGMLCGTALESPIVLDPLQPTTVRYMVQVPIVSTITVLRTGIVNIAGSNYPYSIEGKFHEESGTEMSTTFPVQTAMITSGNLSRIYVNSDLWPNNKSKYICDINIEPNKVEYEIHSAIVNHDPATLIANVYMANSDPSSTAVGNFPIRVVFGTSPTKPLNLDMNFFVTLTIEVEN